MTCVCVRACVDAVSSCLETCDVINNLVRQKHNTPEMMTSLHLIHSALFLNTQNDQHQLSSKVHAFCKISHIVRHCCCRVLALPQEFILTLRYLKADVAQVLLMLLPDMFC